MEAGDSRVQEDDNREGDDKRRHQSGKHSSAEESEGLESGKRRSSSDRSDSQKRPRSSSQAGRRYEDDYDVGRESPKVPRRNSEERGSIRSGSYQDRDVDDSHKSKADETERYSARRSSSRSIESPDHESFQSKSRSKVEIMDEGSRYPDRREGREASIQNDQRNHEQEFFSEHQKSNERSTYRKDQDSSFADIHESRSGKSSDYDKPCHTREIEFGHIKEGDYTRREQQRSEIEKFHNQPVDVRLRQEGGKAPSNSANRNVSYDRIEIVPMGSRPGRAGRMIRRDGQLVGVPQPMMGPPFGHLGLPPGQMHQIIPNMPSFQGQPLGWPGAGGLEINMLAGSPGLLPTPHFGPMGTGFPPMGTGPTHGMYFNQPGLGRGAPSNVLNPGFDATGPNYHGAPHDKAPIGWGPRKNFEPAGKAPSRGEQNDYSQNFVDTGMRPQNFIRELDFTNVAEDYPRLRELIQKKDEIVSNSASPPMYYKCDLREHVLSPEFFGTKFDAILVDPPWEEYVHRAPGVTDNMEHWTFDEIKNLRIEAIADTPSVIFLWVGDGVGLEQGRQCLKKWGFRRVEDICWVKTNKSNATPGLRHDSLTLLQHSKEHCLMGIKGTVRRSSDGHIIHANIDTDVLIAEEPPYGSTKKPEDMYRIVEHFALGKRRLELFGEDHNIRAGWLTLGKDLSSSYFNAEAYTRNFADQDGKVWQGGGGRNPPPFTPHLVVTTPDIEDLRPKSPLPKHGQP